jgi:hypothetical protein
MDDLYDYGFDLDDDYGQDLDEEAARDAHLVDELEEAWQSRFRRTDGFNPMSNTHKQAMGWRRNMADRGNLAQVTKSVLAFMKQSEIDLPSFLYALSGHDKALRSDQVIAEARSTFMHAPDALDILHGFYQHGERWSREDRPKNPLRRFALDRVRRFINKEMVLLKPLMRMSAKEVTVTSLLDIEWTSMVKRTRELAPVFWEVLENAAESRRQKRENKLKSPEAVSLISSTSEGRVAHAVQLVFYVISMAMFFRSPAHGKPIKLITVFLRGQHLSAKSFDVTHELGFTFSQKWVLRQMDSLSCQADVMLLKDSAEYDMDANSDNINIANKVLEQRLDNQDRFDSGCLITVYIPKQPHIVRPSIADLYEQRRRGRANPISHLDLLRLDAKAGQQLKPHLIHLALRVILDAHDFDFPTYQHKADPVLKKPEPIRQLPVGKEYRTTQYIMHAQHQEVATYEGNDRIAQYLLDQLVLRGCDSPEVRKAFAEGKLLSWIGDQLTCSRNRGLVRMRAGEFNSWLRYDNLHVVPGWFHTMMAYANSLHADFYGLGNDFGLAHALKVLERKHMATASTQGNFYHHIDEALHHILYALIRALFLTKSGKKDIADLRKLSPSKLLELATEIFDHDASNGALARYDDLEEGLPVHQRDAVRRKMIVMTRDLLEYVLLKASIRSGDVGIMREFMPRLFFRFSGGGNGNYATEFLEMIQGFEREWPLDLQYVRPASPLASI